MRRVFCVIAVFLLCMSLPLGVFAGDVPAGTVLFAQRYGDFSDPRQTGIRFGTGGGKAALSLEAGLTISPDDDRKVYLLLPDLPDAAGTDTYTVEFSFRFTDVSADNGYFGFLMTAQGDVPSNRTELILRAGGTVDGIGTLGESLVSAMAAGTPVFVTVPVLNGMMYEVNVRCGDAEEKLVLPAVKMIAEGSRGFVLRNASVSVESVAVVNGVGYSKKMGEYASSSYTVPVSLEKPVEPLSPATPDAAIPVFGVAVAAGLTVFLLRRRRCV